MEPDQKPVSSFTSVCETSKIFLNPCFSVIYSGLRNNSNYTYIYNCYIHTNQSDKSVGSVTFLCWEFIKEKKKTRKKENKNSYKKTRVFLHKFFFAWTLSCTSACFRACFCACLRGRERVFFLACFRFFFYKFPAQLFRVNAFEIVKNHFLLCLHSS